MGARALPVAEAFEDVRAFLELGGNVMLAIGAVTFVMWTLILERIWYFRRLLPGEARRVQAVWNARRERKSWHAEQIRRLLISQLSSELRRPLPLIRTLISVCPLLGLLGTVIGMLEAFDVTAVSGGGNPRAMASSVSKALFTTMAGMLAAISGLAPSVQLDRYARQATARVSNSLAREDPSSELELSRARTGPEPQKRQLMGPGAASRDAAQGG